MKTDVVTPFHLVNPNGKADALIICDHASRAVPDGYDDLGLAAALLNRHIGWDIGAGEVSRGLAGRLDAPAVLAGFSRLLIDPNRPLGHEHSIRDESDGVIVPGNLNLAAAERDRRAQAWHAPYHAEIDRHIQARRAAGGVPVLISVHSFTPVMNDFARPWHATLLHADDDRLIAPAMAAFTAGYPELVIGDNEPYTGYSHESFSVVHHAERIGLPNITFEIRQDLIDSPAGIALWVDILANVLAAPLADPAAHEMLPVT